MLELKSKAHEKVLRHYGFDRTYYKRIWKNKSCIVELKGFYNSKWDLIVSTKNDIIFSIIKGSFKGGIRQSKICYINNFSEGFRTKNPKLISNSKARQVSKCLYSANIKPR